MGYTDEDLNAAAGGGALTEPQVVKRKRFIPIPRIDAAEHLPLLSGLNDLFVAGAIVLTLGLAFVLLDTAQPVLAAPFVAVAAWVLGEHFIRERRMALPGIVLMLAFSGAAGWSLYAAIGTDRPDAAWPGWLAIAGGLFVSCVAALAHWIRFRVPITVCALTLAASVSVLALLIAAFPGLKPLAPALLLVIGGLLFGLGLWWDFSDPARITRRSDVAFWLHLAAAPLVVHPLFQILDLFGPSATGTARPWLAVWIYGVLAGVALVIDRRAMLVSLLAYVLPAIGPLIGVGERRDGGYVIPGLLIGGALLLTAIWWRSLRGMVLPWVPAGVLRLLPPEPDRSAATR